MLPFKSVEESVGPSEDSQVSSKTGKLRKEGNKTITFPESIPRELGRQARNRYLGPHGLEVTGWYNRRAFT